MAAHVKVYLAAASLHGQGLEVFTTHQLVDEVERLMGERSATIAAYINAHANGSAPKNTIVVYNYIVRAQRGVRLCRGDDKVHPSRTDALRWPDQDAVEERHWPLWQAGRTYQGGAEHQVATALQQAPPAPAAVAVAEIPHDPLGAYRAAMLEHLWLGQLMKTLWPEPLEVAKPLGTAAGYDLILQCRGILRHVRLITAAPDASTQAVNHHAALWRWQGACVIWTWFDKASLDLVEFGWLDGPDRFQPVSSMPELVTHLFGPSALEGSAAQRLAAYVRSLADFRLERSPAGHYNHMGATLAEAILQAAIDYRSVVVPRVQRILREHPEAATTSGFLRLLEWQGPESVIQMNGGDKPARLIAITRFFAQEGVEVEDQLRHWLGSAANLERLRGIHGVGPKTVDYIQILVGINTSAVDRHLAQFVANAGVAATTYEARQRVIRAAAALLGVEEAMLDYGIWLYMSERAR